MIDVNRKNMSNWKGLRNFKNIFLFCTSTLILFFFPFPDSLCVLLFPPAGMRSPKPFVSVRQLRNHIEVNSQDRKHSPIYLLNMLGFDQGSWWCPCSFPLKHDSTHLASKHWNFKKDSTKWWCSLYFSLQFQTKKSEYAKWTTFILPQLLQKEWKCAEVLRH